MGFDLRDIRPAMDVYTLDNVYLGTVLRVVPGRGSSIGEPAPPAVESGSDVSGEALGPAPTAGIGNEGPLRQSARAGYGAAGDGARPIGDGTLVVGRWWGLIGRRLIPMALVQTVSLERVVLSVRKDEMPERRGPAHKARSAGR